MPVTVILVFLAFLGTFVGAYALFTQWFKKRDTVRLRDRLLERTPDEKPLDGAQPLLRKETSSAKHFVSRMLTALKLDVRLQELMEQAGLRWSPGRTALLMLVIGIGVFDLVWYGLPFLRFIAVFAGAACGALPLAYIAFQRRSRMRKFESQFPDALEFVSRAMRTGHAFSVSLEMLHQEFPEPLGGEFRRTFDEQNLGLPLDIALEKLGKRIPMIDVHFFVSAVLLQKRTGGNLAEILDKLASLIRERFKLRGQIRTISAQGRMSGLVLWMIPMTVGGIMTIVNPDHMRFFIDDIAGNWMVGLALGLQVLGFLVIRKIVDIEV